MVILKCSDCTRLADASASVCPSSRNSPELLSSLAWSVWFCRFPQFDGIPLRVMQVGEPAVGIRLRVNLDRDSRSLKLGRHFVEIPDSKVQHPNLAGIPEIIGRLRKRSETRGACLLLPSWFPVARWYRQN